MVGDHVDAIIADAYVKGIRSFEADAEYRLMRKNATQLPNNELYVDGRGKIPACCRPRRMPHCVAAVRHQRLDRISPSRDLGSREARGQALGAGCGRTSRFVSRPGTD